MLSLVMLQRLIFIHHTCDHRLLPSPTVPTLCRCIEAAQRWRNTACFAGHGSHCLANIFFFLTYSCLFVCISLWFYFAFSCSEYAWLVKGLPSAGIPLCLTSVRVLSGCWEYQMLFHPESVQVECPWLYKQVFFWVKLRRKGFSCNFTAELYCDVNILPVQRRSTFHIRLKWASSHLSNTERYMDYSAKWHFLLGYFLACVRRSKQTNDRMTIMGCCVDTTWSVAVQHELCWSCVLWRESNTCVCFWSGKLVVQFPGNVVKNILTHIPINLNYESVQTPVNYYLILALQ